MQASGWDCHVHLFDDSAPTAPGAHYRPVPRQLEEIEALAAAHGIGHLVLVQPSVYGTDNRLLLQGLRDGGGRHRGVVVVDASVDDRQLEGWHALGVRGVRFNLVSPVGSAAEEAQATLRALAPSLRRLGWHVQVYASPAALPQVVRWQAASGLRFVLDHLAGMTAAHADDAVAWEALRRLAEAGAWIKLSAWYRLQAVQPYDALDLIIARVAGLFEGRMVWGSDWPHTSFAPESLPTYASVMEPVGRALPGRVATTLAAGSLLYA